MSAINRVLDRLDGVRQTAPTKWRARCGAHGGKSLSLAVADVDGRVLIKCFAGCDTAAVLAAAGLTFGELFDASLGDFKPAHRSPWNARDVVDLAVVEAHVVGLIASDIARRRNVSDAEWHRLSQAAGRLIAMAGEVR
jgi:hypothetical protein